MPTKPATSLTEFVKKNPSRRGSPCWLCNIPEREMIETAKRERTATTQQIQRWLVEERGYPADDVTRGRLTNHFQSGHHQS